MMQYKGYLGKVEFDSEAGMLHGEVAGIRDVVTFQGESVKEVEQAFRESVDDYLAFCRQRGEAPEKPFSGQFVVRVPPKLHRGLNMLAQMTGQSMNTLVTECLSQTITDRLGQATLVSPSRGRSRKARRGHAIG